MQVPAQVKPAAWGAVGGAIAAMIIGFAWGGWVTGGTSEKNAGVAAQPQSCRRSCPFAWPRPSSSRSSSPA